MTWESIPKRRRMRKRKSGKKILLKDARQHMIDKCRGEFFRDQRIQEQREATLEKKLMPFVTPPPIQPDEKQD